MNSKILIICGDPNSINSEIIFKAWKKITKLQRERVTLIGNFQLLSDQAKKLRIKVPLKKIDNINRKNDKNFLNIIDYPLKYKKCFHVQDKEASKYVIGCLNLANKICTENKIKGFINCPIDKKLIKKKGIHGVTEFIAKKSRVKKYSEVMMLYNKKLSVVPITTHIKIMNISKNINKKVLIKKINTLNFYFKKIFKYKPVIAVLGLNPHNAEYEKHSEEVKQIIPAVKYLKKNANIFGPMAPDSFFNSDYKKYDVIVGMYHDQVLIPFKNLFKFDAINITLGLKYIRMSPDHGTAKDIIGKNLANNQSLINCINFLDRFK
tara:strand:+ start:2043 stop:3005 length:963 start_codon:yes stop_codon:yes gene_type:complete